MTEAKQLIDRLIEDSVSKYQSFAYAAGYLGSMLSECLATMPEHSRREFIRQLERSCKTTTQKTAKNG